MTKRGTNSCCINITVAPLVSTFTLTIFLSDDMLIDMSKPEFRSFIKDISSDKYGVDQSRVPAKETLQHTASYRKLNVD